jgi:hypothetical protein
MGLGIVFASLISAVADKTGDDSLDAVVKIKRLVNEKGPDFCSITDFPFKRSDISFSITTAAYKYSGASYLPTTFNGVQAAFILDSNNDRHPLNEVGIVEAHDPDLGWKNPDENDGIPDEFCITRMESGYWEIQFNRKPDQTLTVYLEISLQWTDLSATTDEAIITKPYYPAFAHFVSMARFVQQGDAENLAIAKMEWWDQNNPKVSILGRLLGSLSKPLQRKRVVVDMEQCGQYPQHDTPDYNQR